MASSLLLAIAGHASLLLVIAPGPPSAVGLGRPLEVEIWVDDDDSPKPNPEVLEFVPGEVPDSAARAYAGATRGSASPGRKASLPAGQPVLPGQREIPVEVPVAEPDRGGSWADIDPRRVLGLGSLSESFDQPTGPLRVHAKSAVHRGIDRALAEFAAEVPHLSQRPPPTLALRADGSLRYKSASIEAVIGTDGSVDFSPRDPIQAELHVTSEGVLERLVDKDKRRKWIEEVYGGQVVVDPKYSGRTEERPTTVPLLGGTFDTCALEPRDCYSHEKQWFMEQTKELREEIHQRWRELNLRRSLYELEVVLSALETDLGLGMAQKRTRLQELLADCADDWEGEQAKQMIQDSLGRLEPTEYARVPDAGQTRPDAGPS